MLQGPVDDALLDALAAPEVIAVVVGARGTPAGRRPAGRTALGILERAGKPIVVVPPEAVAPADPAARSKARNAPPAAARRMAARAAAGTDPLR